MMTFKSEVSREIAKVVISENWDRDATGTFDQHAGMPARQFLERLANRLEIDQTILDDRCRIRRDRRPVPDRVDEVFWLARAARFKELEHIVIVTRANRFHSDGIDPFGSGEPDQPAGDESFPDAGVCACHKIVHAPRFFANSSTIASASCWSSSTSGPSRSSRAFGSVPEYRSMTRPFPFSLDSASRNRCCQTIELLKGRFFPDRDVAQNLREICAKSDEARSAVCRSQT